MPQDLRERHQKQLQQLQAALRGNRQALRVKKKTISNLFRYEDRQGSSSRQIDLSGFDQPLFLDQTQLTLDVQGLTTFERIVDFVHPFGLAPVVTPELKHITIGGAVVGVGIETNSYRHGFVHDSLLEAEVLLSDGSVVTCSPRKHPDLFYGLPNSYGTLGYILSAKIRLRSAKPFVNLTTTAFTGVRQLLAAMHQAVSNRQVDYIESLAYSPGELYLTTSQETDTPHDPATIYGPAVFYRQISRPGKLCLSTVNYLFRYDPEWFWGLGDSAFYRGFRLVAPRALRNSGFYARYYRRQKQLSAWLPFLREDDQLEKLIQDWEVPWDQSEALLSFALSNLDLNGKPLMAAPLKTPALASCYPMRDQLYLNLGSYNYVRRRAGQRPYHHTRIIDDFCFSRGGIKMLYSATFLAPDEFDRIYAGDAYALLKRKYDPQGLLPTLYEKAVKAR
jgi:FAD/FMN-containing dehydrogenase